MNSTFVRNNKVKMNEDLVTDKINKIFKTLPIINEIRILTDNHDTHTHKKREISNSPKSLKIQYSNKSQILKEKKNPFSY